MKKKQRIEEEMLREAENEEFIEATINDYDEDGSNDVKKKRGRRESRLNYKIFNLRVTTKTKNLFGKLRI